MRRSCFYCIHADAISRLELIEQKVREQLRRHPEQLNLSPEFIEEELTPQDITLILSQLSPQQQRSLHDLIINYRHLRDIPFVVFNFIELRILDLSHNNLIFMAPEIGKLTNLEFVNLDDNELVDLPPTFKKLTHLNCLILSNNFLERIPDEIFHLTNLHTLWLYRNRIHRVSRRIGNLVNLRSLYLSENDIQRLPKEIFKLRHLTVLLIYDNKLQKFPIEIGRLATHLSLLDVTENEPPFSDMYKKELCSILPTTSIVF